MSSTTPTSTGGEPVPDRARRARHPQRGSGGLRRRFRLRLLQFDQLPDTIHAGIRVAKLGNSSVRYEIALYCNDDPLPCAACHFVHVYVERSSNRSVPIPMNVRNALKPICGAVPTN
jgi:acyl-CoA thioesterase FadM